MLESRTKKEVAGFQSSSGASFQTDFAQSGNRIWAKANAQSGLWGYRDPWLHVPRCTIAGGSGRWKVPQAHLCNFISRFFGCGEMIGRGILRQFCRRLENAISTWHAYGLKEGFQSRSCGCHVRERMWQQDKCWILKVTSTCQSCVWMVEILIRRRFSQKPACDEVLQPEPGSLSRLPGHGFPSQLRAP